MHDNIPTKKNAYMMLYVCPLRKKKVQVMTDPSRNGFAVWAAIIKLLPSICDGSMARQY
jgi:hypothetical protein